MQMLGMNYTQGAQMRSNATLAVNDIIDRMRLNPEGVAANAYDSVNTNTSIPANPNCMATGCNSTQLAAHDIRVWAGYFGKADATNTSTPLLGAVGTISVDSNGFHTVKIEWEELISGESETREVTMGVNLN